ncbi:MAG: hypothetical protein K2K64_08090 [Muribaculaceae bacterium]|nr:hypothetical protein [Muribaculaceae bacterium]
MNPFLAIAGAIALFFLFIFVLALMIVGIFGFYFRIQEVKLEYHKKKIRKRWEQQHHLKQPTEKCERPKIEIVPEELYAVTKEEYEANMMGDAPQSPLYGIDSSYLEEQLPNNQSTFFNPAQN